MNKQEAIQAMKEGKRVRHVSFEENEWLSSNPEGTLYTTEDEIEHIPSSFWSYRQTSRFQEGWEIVPHAETVFCVNCEKMYDTDDVIGRTKPQFVELDDPHYEWVETIKCGDCETIYTISNGS